MKKTIGFIIFIALVGIFACNRDSEEVTNGSGAQAGVKEWFDTSFKKSNEWLQNPDSQKKFPDWSKGTYLKKDGMEIFEFPLTESKTTISVPADKSLTTSDTKKILEAILMRLVIIKTETKEMLVCKLYYVPEYKYLSAKGYDISDVMFGKTNDDFTGLLITKKWNDEVISYNKVKNGKITEVLTKYNPKDPQSNSLNRVDMSKYTTARTGGLGDEQNLDELIIVNTYKAPTTYTYFPSEPYYSSPPSGSGYPYGGGTGGGYGDNSGGDLVMPPPPEIPISDIKKFLSCFNSSSSASLTVFAERMGNGNGVGHAFISITQGNNNMVFGYYPRKGGMSVLIGPGIMGENGGHHYDISVNMSQISSQQLQQIISLSESYQSKSYDLSFNNCSDFATDVLNIAGVSTTGYIDTPNTVANILTKIPNHTSNSSYASSTRRTCP